MQKSVTIIGGGIAGCEAAFFAAEHNCSVTLYEMRPNKMTSAHKTDLLAELVCSNSLRNEIPTSAAGCLKEELKMLGSITIKTALETKVPAGKSLAVDRNLFSKNITELISNHPNIKLIREEITKIPDENVIIATGPLSSDSIISAITNLIGNVGLNFYDAIAPIIDAESLTPDSYFFSSRYGNSSDYINIPLSKEEYNNLIQDLTAAEINTHLKEDRIFFEGCLPIEEMARRGKDTPRFGPMKPVGLINPKTGKRPYAVIQLRREELSGKMYNLVGFQTQLKIADQERIFRKIPSFQNASFIRFGSAHRNTFIDSPKVLLSNLSLKNIPRIKIAGQLSGVEGYIESAASGIAAAAYLLMEQFIPLPYETIIGGLLNYITLSGTANFQPMKANWGLVSECAAAKSTDKKEILMKRSLNALQSWIKLCRFDT